MGKKDDGKPKGRMSAYAYFVQTCREEHKKKHPNENVVFAEFSRKCADRWKTMNDKEKQRFHTMAEKDKKRYEGEMAGYKPPKGEKGKKRKRVKDPNAPKRALSAFFWFCNDERPRVKEILPDSTVGDVAKELGRRWNQCTDDQKSKFEALAAKDKARYEKENNAYKSSGKKPGKAASPAKGKKAPVKAAPVEDSDDDDDDDDDDDEDDD